MIKLNINNSVIDCELNNVVFSNIKQNKDGKPVPNLNLIYASNTSGKSSTANIIYKHFNNEEQLENKFDGKKSSIKIIYDDNNISNAYKYDREFASKSTEFYKNELIIAPKNAKAVVDNRSSMDENRKEVVFNYKKNDVYSELKKIDSKLYKAEKIYSFSLSSLKEGDHWNNICNELVNVYQKSNMICYDFSILELIDFASDKTSFFNQCLKSDEEIKEMIYNDFPDIDSNDSDFYSKLVEYLSNKQDKLIDKLCLMCGKTILTKEIIQERINVLNLKIKEYSDSVISNKFLVEFEAFKNQKFHSDLFIGFQTSLRMASNSNLIFKLTEIGNKLSQINLNVIKKNAFDCIISKILEDHKISELITERVQLIEKSREIAKENKQVINTETVKKFNETLKHLQFKYFDKAKIELDSNQNIIKINFDNIEIGEMFREILSESEKSILSFSLFKAIIKTESDSMIIIDDPIDSHDQKNKWFILNNIIELLMNTTSTVIVFTHELMVSKMIKEINQNIEFTNFVLTKSDLTEITGPSLYFSELYNYIYEVIGQLERLGTDNEKYFLPLAFLMRYLSKNQFKLIREIDFHCSSPLDPNLIKRREVKEIGFNSLSDDFVHYKNVDSNQLLNDIEKVLKLNRISTTKPSYFKTSIDTDILIEEIIRDIGTKEQYDKELSKIMTSLLIRNILEKKIRAFVSVPSGRTNMSKLVDIYRTTYGDDNLISFYNKNKAMVNEFAHLESGIDALLTYDIEYIDDQLRVLKLI
ncbi:hypothetical protein [Acholeplasma laidlawii]|uniref:hypothetical protein n=1 Tax=Acholeplasma laidlawii TaxID=2148 RepID=UPI0021F73D12|nr:hypothetical protein [Acholeplasma laidlawii]